MFPSDVVHELAGLIDRLAELPAAADDGERIDRIAVLEKLKAAVYAAQVTEVAEFTSSQEATNMARGVRRERARRGVAEQVGLARKVPAASAARQVSQAQARRLAIEADPAAAVARAGKARKDRRVGVRPAPDTMATLSALLPCEQGVAAYAALRRHADAQVADGDERSRDQIMADTLVERLTGQTSAGAVSAEIGLVMTDAALLGAEQTPAELDGYGPVPAETARTIARHASESGCDLEGVTVRKIEWAQVWIRRLLVDPVTGVVENCDARRRRFDGVLAKLLLYRDRTCRDPYCDAPIRHHDHINPYAAGGTTTPTNGRGVCQRGNHIRQMPGWQVELLDPDRHIVQTTTPTGHTYHSAPPRAPNTNRHKAATVVTAA